jgi:hypothetical protein
VDATWHEHLAMVRCLVEQGARMELTMRSGSSPMNIAKRNDNQESIRALEGRQAFNTAQIAAQKLGAAVKQNDVATVRKLIAEGLM